MISIILAWSPEARERAIAAGFRERTVLVRDEVVVPTTDKTKQERITAQVLREIKPFQYLLSSWWGAGPE